MLRINMAAPKTSLTQLVIVRLVFEAPEVFGATGGASEAIVND